MLCWRPLLFTPGILYPPGMISQSPIPKSIHSKLLSSERNKSEEKLISQIPHIKRHGSAQHSVFNRVTLESITKSVRMEPGHTAAYYGKKYFDKIYSLEIKTMLWKLKKKGSLRMERDAEGSAIWFVNHEGVFCV